LSMMLFRILTFILISLTVSSAVEAYDTLQVTASLDTTAKEIMGKVRYDLPDFDGLSEFHFQLFANLYSDKDSPYLKFNEGISQRLSANTGWGETIVDSIFVDGQPAGEYLEINYAHAVVQVPDSDLSGSTVEIYFVTRIPFSGDRLAYIGNEYILDMWFPRPAIFKDDGSWYMPEYTAYAEPVSEYYHFDISINVPSELIVAASSEYDEIVRSDTIHDYRYQFGPAHDFVVSISPDYKIDTSTIKEIDVLIYYRDYEKPVLDRIRGAIHKSIEYMTEKVGPYKYRTISAATILTGFSGGIEFPGLIVMTSPGGGMMATRSYEALVIHEMVHQWFYGMIGSNQVEYPWMDESITSFFESEIIKYYWGNEANIFGFTGIKLAQKDYNRLSGMTYGRNEKIAKPVGGFAFGSDYFGTVYARGTLAFETFNNIIGPELSDSLWKQYYNSYLFKRPEPQDLFDVVTEVAGESNLNVLKSLLYDAEIIDYSISGLVNERLDTTRYEVSLIMNRKGFLPVPVAYSLILANDDTLTYLWHPQYNTERITHSTAMPVMEAAIDPDNLIAVDANLLNNSMKYRANNWPGLRIANGLIFFIETMISFLGGM